MNNHYPYSHVREARAILTDVINLAAFRMGDQLKLEYTTQAGDEVEVSINQGDMQTKAVITYSIEDGPRSRTETQTITSACLWTLLKDLNGAAQA